MALPVQRRTRWVALSAVALLVIVGAACAELWRRGRPVVPVNRLAPPADPSVPIGVPTARPDRVSLLAFGDWGQEASGQRDVAAGIAAYARAGNPFDAGVLLGDNFYFPLRGVDDPRWETMFDALYEPKDLRFWAVLGNHDYYTALAKSVPGVDLPPDRRPTNRDVQIARSRLHPGGRFNLPAPWYRLDLPPNDPLVTLLMLDSNYRAIGSRSDEWPRQLAWLRSQLAELRPVDAGDGAATGPDGSPSGDDHRKRTARQHRRWVIACGHNPIFTNGNAHADDRRLIADWLPLLERHGVDLYLAGHNHLLEHPQPTGSAITHLVSGGGGAILYGVHWRHAGWAAKAHGFTHLIATPDAVEVKFLDITGAPLYRMTRLADGTERVDFVAPQTTRLTTAPAPATRPMTQPEPDYDLDARAPDADGTSAGARAVGVAAYP